MLSGYLIAGQLFNKVHLGKDISLKEFYVKRFFRIIPAYLAVVAVYFCIPGAREKESLPPLWKFLTFTQNFGLEAKDYGTFSHAWSLCVEEQFYLLLPLIILAFLYFNAGKKAYYFIIGLFIAGFIIRFINWYAYVEPVSTSVSHRQQWLEWIYYPTYNRLDGLLVGISIAGTFVFYPRIKNMVYRCKNFILLCGILLFIAAWFVCEPRDSFVASIFGFPLISVAYGAIVTVAVTPSGFLYESKSKVTSFIAALSYSIYLIHKITIHLSQELFINFGIAIDGTLMFFLSIVVTLIGAIILRTLIEKPALQLRDAVLMKERQSFNAKIFPIYKIIKKTMKKSI